MKYAFMTFSAPEQSLEALLDMATQYGYDGIEPRIGSEHKHGIELTASSAERRAIREAVAATNVALCCIATSCKYADPETAPRWIAETRRAIDLAADLGVTRLRVFGGAIPAGLERTSAIEHVATALRSVADEAQEHDVTLCLETHDDWCDPAHVAAIMDRVNHPAIGVNWDYMHTIRVAHTSVDEAFSTLQPWIKHVHVHDGADRADKLVFLPIGAGEYDNHRVLELLQSTNYDGYLSGEWINWEPGEVHLPREIQSLRALERAIGPAS
jgi:sugar phosphate isomerase/epimerase